MKGRIDHLPTCQCKICSGEYRYFTQEDLLTMKVLCPHCNKLLQITEADGPFFDLATRTYYWLVILEDGEGARFWEDNKGIKIDNPQEILK